MLARERWGKPIGGSGVCEEVIDLSLIIALDTESEKLLVEVSVNTSCYCRISSPCGVVYSRCIGQRYPLSNIPRRHIFFNYIVIRYSVRHQTQLLSLLKCERHKSVPNDVCRPHIDGPSHGAAIATQPPGESPIGPVVIGIGGGAACKRY
jgi:hypothetical protein